MWAKAYHCGSACWEGHIGLAEFWTNYFNCPDCQSNFEPMVIYLEDIDDNGHTKFTAIWRPKRNKV